jgi:transcriptional regulator GlxA family with amidase domain
MSETKTIAFVLYPGVTILDLVGPLQVVTGLKMFDPSYEAAVVAESLDVFETDTPLRVAAQKTFAEVERAYGVLVPGGGAPTLRAMGDSTLTDYVRQLSDSATVVTSVCTGALILAAAGLLEGRKATTHWAYYRFLERLGAGYLPERWVEDGKFITSAGVSAGIDMALFLVSRLTDEATARSVQLGIEYDPHPPFGGIDWSGVDRDLLMPMLTQHVRQELSDRPDLLERLDG